MLADGDRGRGSAKKPSFKRIYVRGVVAAYVEPQITTRNLQSSRPGSPAPRCRRERSKTPACASPGSSSRGDHRLRLPGLPGGCRRDHGQHAVDAEDRANRPPRDESIAPEPAGYTTGFRARPRPRRGRDDRADRQHRRAPLRVDRFSMFAGVARA